MSRRKIDTAAWDQAISTSASRSLFALSWYLDTVSPGWAAIIDADYATVMPLPVTWKWGIPLITQPDECPHLGIFSRHDISSSLVSRALKSIPHWFPLVRITLNYSNSVCIDYFVTQKITYLLSLDNSSNPVANNYSRDTIRNIKKAMSRGVVVRETSNVSLIVDFFHKNARDGHLPPAFARVIPVLYEHQQVVIYGAFAGNELVSATVFARNFSNYVNLYSVTSRRGRDLSANYLVINTFIKNHRAPGMYLDFEGSSIPGVEKYFAGFGGTRLAYPHVRLLNLPFIHQRIW